jgi:hypothetical protein
LASNLRPRRLEATAGRPEDAVELGRLRHATRTGRPCGDASFVEQMKQRLGRACDPVSAEDPCAATPCRRAPARGGQSPGFLPV